MTVLPQVAGYTIIRQIGKGNMGVVYLAVALETGQQIALKQVQGGSDPDARERIEAEERGALLQQRLAAADPHVVAVHKVFRADGDLQIDMEYVPGRDLFELLEQEGRLEPQRAAIYALELCRMLEHLRKTANVVHSDLKPRNIRITPEDTVKVLDFGIAKALAEARPGTFNAFQSLPYSSPERVRSGNVDHQSDLWSVGVMLYEMVMGHRPFAGQGEALRDRILEGAAEPLACPAPLAAIIGKCLARDLSQRYASAGELIGDLARFLNGQPVLAKVPDPDATRRTVPQAWDAEATRRTAPVYPPPRAVYSKPLERRRRWPLVLFSLFLALALSLVVFVRSQAAVSRQAGEVKRELDTRNLSVADAWNTYENLQGRAKLPFLLTGLRSSLRNNLIETAEYPVYDYRHDQPSAKLRDWDRAYAALQHALELKGSDNEVLGLMSLIDGHRARIHAESAKGDRQASFSAALNDFEEAARKLHGWPDPYLGMARVYFYDKHDFEKGRKMLDEAEKRHYSIGRREKAQMADTLRYEGASLEHSAARFASQPDQARGYLERSLRDYRQAADLYSGLGDFTPSVPARLNEMLAGIHRVEDRLAHPEPASQLR